MTIIRSWFIIAIMKRIKYCYERLIAEWNLENEFKHYCYHHPKIKSRRRLARNFLLKLGFSKYDFMHATIKEARLQEEIRIAKTPWLD